MSSFQTPETGVPVGALSLPVNQSWFGGCLHVVLYPWMPDVLEEQNHPQLRIAAPEDSDKSFKFYQTDSLIFKMLKQGFQCP